MPDTQFKNLWTLGTVLILAVSLLSCSEAEKKTVTAPAPSVSVYEVDSEEIGNYREFVARTVASKTASLRARVEGELIKRHFNEGSKVTQNQTLLEIDPTNYQASVASATADLNSATVTAASTGRDLARGKKIAADGFISSSELDQLITKEAQARAQVKVAKAELTKAELNLSYTSITAPFSGRVGKVKYNVGNVVGPNSEPLAILTLTDPINVNFQIEESNYINFLQENTKTATAKDVQVDISLRLPNDTIFAHAGSLDFADTKIEEGMGTVELRATFANPRGIIIPGMFVTLMIEGQEKEKMSLVPQAAVQANQQGKFVLVVDNENMVKQRHVILGRRINAMWLVKSGLKSGDLVVVEGLQKIKSGIKVNPVVKMVDGKTGTISLGEPITPDKKA